jgi:hypothetical protein
VITTEESLAQSKESIGLLKKTGSIQRIKFNARRSFKVSHSKEQGYDAHRLQDIKIFSTQKQQLNNIFLRHSYEVMKTSKGMMWCSVRAIRMLLLPPCKTKSKKASVKKDL